MNNKELMKRLRFCKCKGVTTCLHEAARNALEAMEKDRASEERWADEYKAERDKLQAELAEERRLKELAEKRVEEITSQKSADEKALWEKYEAARWVAFRLHSDVRMDEIDAMIAAKLKEVEK